MSKLFSGLGGFKHALTDLEQSYEDIREKINKAILAMYGWDKNDNEDYDIEDEFTLLEPWESGDDAPDRDREPELGGYIPYDEDYKE